MYAADTTVSTGWIAVLTGGDPSFGVRPSCFGLKPLRLSSEEAIWPWPILQNTLERLGTAGGRRGDHQGRSRLRCNCTNSEPNARFLTPGSKPVAEPGPV